MAIETNTETTALLIEMDAAPLTGVVPGQVSGGCGIRTREGLHPTRFPNPQTEVQVDPQGSAYAYEAIRRTLTDRREREQLRPKLRPKVSGLGREPQICTPQSTSP
jgi:hypothetical protein